MKNKFKGIVVLATMILSLVMVCNMTVYAYDEAVVEYIADAIEDTKTTVDGMAQYGVKPEELSEVFNLALAKNYELAYTYDWIRIEGSYMINGSGNITQFPIKYDFDNKTTNAEVKERYAKVDAQLDKIEALVDDSWSDLDKILFVHDYIVENVSYDWSGFTTGDLEDAQFSLYGALIDKKVVCEGYSKLFMVMMHRLGYESVLVVSDEKAHMWNMVKLNGSWYHVDCTHDDPIMSGADTDLKGRVGHTYFLLSDSAIADNKHYPWNAGVPSCTSTLYDNWKYADSKSKFIPLDDYWYYSDPTNGDNLVKRSKSDVVTVLSKNGAYGLAEIDGRIYYTDKYRKDIYRYYNGTTTLVYTLNNDKYISCMGLTGNQMEIAVFDSSNNYSWIKMYVGNDYSLTSNTNYNSVVSNVKVSNNTANTVKLSWNAASNATGYKIYVYNSKTGAYTYKCKTTSTNCTVTGLYSAREYTFAIKAYTDIAGGTKDSSKNVKVSTTTTPMGVSSVTYVKNWNTSVTVKYPAVTGAAGYRLQVYNLSTGKVVKTLYVTKLQNVITGLTQGTKYRVVVTPYLKYNGKTYYSTVKKNTLAATRMANPTIKVSGQTTNTITLSWNKVPGASGYYIYKYNAKTGKYVYYKDVKTTSCKIDGMYSGNAYTFAIKPYISISYTSNGVKKTDVFVSHSKSFSACTAPMAPKPTLSTANKTITVKWNRVTGATSYVVYCKTTASGAWVNKGTTTSTSLKLTGLTKGKTYYVTVKAFKKYNTQNAGSGITTKSIVVK